MGGKIVSNCADPLLYRDSTPSATILETLKQATTVGYMNQVALSTKPFDRENYYANNSKLLDIHDAKLYTSSDVTTQVADPIEVGVFNTIPNTVALEAFQKTAMNMGSVEAVAVCLNSTDRTSYDAHSK